VLSEGLNLGGSAPQPDPIDAAHQADPVRRRRLRWRCRRGMLENDLIMTRFLDRHEATLSDSDVQAVDTLMDLSDNALLDLILGRENLSAEYDHASIQAVLTQIRNA
jgi:antitoxin CptB